ncbi:hypothetical protein ACHAL6_14015 [Proteiniclasticum sp. C24MP]|uniref:hypothetical protein n=1 Tax=Proteiniclasticum sp. C24MP TaxID=3374101 RepID=UPI003755275A
MKFYSALPGKQFEIELFIRGSFSCTGRSMGNSETEEYLNQYKSKFNHHIIYKFNTIFSIVIIMNEESEIEVGYGDV